MVFKRRLHLIALFITLGLFWQLSGSTVVAQPQATQAATLGADAIKTIAARCAAPVQPATPEMSATLPATMPAVATSEQGAILRFIAFEPTDIKFNPSAEKPVVVVIVFSLVFENELNETIRIENPQFELSIEGVSWGKIASTDFQVGQMLANATQGIVLQSLTIMAKATDAQKAVLECLKNKHPVTLTLTGTMDVTRNGEKQKAQASLSIPNTIFRERQK